MTADLVKTVYKKGYGKIINRITKSLRNFGISPDFEAIYTILDALTNPRQAIKESNPFAAYVCRDPEQIGAYPKLVDVLRDFRNYIYEQCTIKSSVLQDKKVVYDTLFRVLEDYKSISDKRFFTKDICNLNETQVPLGRTIVTTNYDMSIELYHNLINQRYADGFRMEYNPYVKEMDVQVYAEGNESGNWLIKLHGAIWQFKQADKIIKTTVDPKSHLCPIPIEVDEQMMIYPTGEKPILRDPYYVFYKIFKAQKWSKMIAIGYSFRDDPVNIAVLENLDKVKEANLIVVDPCAENVVQNLGNLALSRYNDRIIRVQGNFEDEWIFDELEVALNACSWKDYEEEVKKREEKRVRQGDLEPHYSFSKK